MSESPWTQRIHALSDGNKLTHILHIYTQSAVRFFAHKRRQPTFRTTKLPSRAALNTFSLLSIAIASIAIWARLFSLEVQLPWNILPLNYCDNTPLFSQALSTCNFGNFFPSRFTSDPSLILDFSLSHFQLFHTGSLLLLRLPSSLRCFIFSSLSPLP